MELSVLEKGGAGLQGDAFIAQPGGRCSVAIAVLATIKSVYCLDEPTSAPACLMAKDFPVDDQRGLLPMMMVGTSFL